jgi:hypothetical protein
MNEDLTPVTQLASPWWFVSLGNSALLHFSALIYGDVEFERLFGFTDLWSLNDLLAFFQRLQPGKKFPDDIEGLGIDRISMPREMAEEVLRWIKGEGWDNLEKGVKEMTEDWV